MFLLSIGLLVPEPASLHLRVNSRMDAREKKTWTNEDTPLLRQAAPISIFADNSTAQPNTSEGAGGAEVEAATQPYVKERDPRWNAKQRQALHAQIDAKEDQIREIQIRETGEGFRCNPPVPGGARIEPRGNGENSANSSGAVRSSG